jgi:hypothetical protein
VKAALAAFPGAQIVSVTDFAADLPAMNDTGDIIADDMPDEDA